MENYVKCYNELIFNINLNTEEIKNYRNEINDLNKILENMT